MAPVFSLVLDKDVREDIALQFPELYKDLIKVKFRFTLKCFAILQNNINNKNFNFYHIPVY